MEIRRLDWYSLYQCPIASAGIPVRITVTTMTISMTYDLAMAAAKDEANRQMRSAGRKVWSSDDYNLAVQTFERLLPQTNHHDLSIVHMKFKGRKWDRHGSTCAGRFSSITGKCDLCDATLVLYREVM